MNADRSDLSSMDTEPHITQLEQALLEQAETLAREQQANAVATRERILAESAEKLRLAEEREVLAAKIAAERLLKREMQAAESQLTVELDQLRWALTASALDAVDQAFQTLTRDRNAYRAVLEAWLQAAVAALPEGELIAEVRADDEHWLRSEWDAVVARAAPDRAVHLQALANSSLGGLRVRLVNNRVQVDQTYEARRARLADALALLVMERLFASTPDLELLLKG